MSQFTEHKMDLSKAKKLFNILMLLFCLLPVLLETIALTPLYVSLQADVAYADGVLAIAIYYLKDIFSLLAFSSAYALIIFAVSCLTKKQARSVMFIYALIFFLQIPLKLAMNIPVHGSLGTGLEILIDLLYLLFYFLLNMLQLLVVYFFATTDMNKYLQYAELLRAKRKAKGKKEKSETPEPILPVTRLLNRYNPLQRSAFKMGLLMLGLKVISRMLNDLSYGAPTSFGATMVMLTYYLSDILYGVVAYFMALLIFGIIYDKLKKETDEDLSPSISDESSII